MFIISQIEQILSYIAEAIVEIFSPNDDTYPATGVQPFDGDSFE